MTHTYTFTKMKSGEYLTKRDGVTVGLVAKGGDANKSFWYSLDLNGDYISYRRYEDCMKADYTYKQIQTSRIRVAQASWGVFAS